MDNFDITFLYRGKTYAATIHKEISRPVIYFASIHTPHDLEIDRDISFVALRHAGMLEWANIYEYPDLAAIIAAAITAHVRKKVFNLFKI